MDKPESCFSPHAAGGGLSIGLSGNAALDVLALCGFSRHDRMDGLKNGSDEAFVSGAAGLILLNPDHQKLFSPLRRRKKEFGGHQPWLKDEPFLHKISNEEKKLVRKLPTPSQVATWVKQAQNSLAT